MKLYEILDSKIDTVIKINNINLFKTMCYIDNIRYECDFEKIKSTSELKSAIDYVIDLNNDYIPVNSKQMTDNDLKKLKSLMQTMMNGELQNLYDVEFSIIYGHKRSFELSNLHNANKVFNFIKQSFELLKQYHKIDYICYSSKGNKRTNTYKKLISKVINIKDEIKISYNENSFILLKV